MAASKCRSGPETGREVRRVTADLAEYLSSDRYPLHSRLPPERQLCELLQVSRTALRNGLEELEREGRIWRHVVAFAKQTYLDHLLIDAGHEFVAALKDWVIRGLLLNGNQGNLHSCHDGAPRC